jgi:hypothetical protein
MRVVNIHHCVLSEGKYQIRGGRGRYVFVRPICRPLIFFRGQTKKKIDCYRNCEVCSIFLFTGCASYFWTF